MKTLKIGAVVYDPRVTVIWEMIEDFFKERGQEIEAVFFKDYRLQVDALVNGEIDGAWNSPLAHLDAHKRLEGKEKIGCMRDTDRDLHTCLLVRADSGIGTLEDLKGKTIAFGAVDSPQARLIPIEHLHRNGLEFEKDYVEKRFDIGVGLHGDHVGGEKDAAMALVAGEVDASFALAANYEAWTKDGSIDKNVVRLLDTTDPFDHCIFTFREGIDDEEIKAFDAILMEMDYGKEPDREILDVEGLKKWVEGRTDGYGPITAADAYLGGFVDAINHEAL